MSDPTQDNIEVSGDQDAVPTTPLTDAEAVPGGRIGPYKLARILGEGGFGIVFLAEQSRPIKRTVALKVIKPGMDSKQVIARFEIERQALALLDHPHIARVFNAGTTEAGRPYFAMEYVKGIPITDYCDKYNLSVQKRLRLFIPLCEAVQHAHQKGIVHRDVKPSNALVILHDEKPIPKIIDFGVAKALHQPLTESTVVTAEGQFIGTPEYMSPEQAEFTGLDIDARTDIYSLGVLLYKLLTGQTPFDSEDLRNKGYAEMQRIICEQEPLRPSAKLAMLGGSLDDVARHRRCTGEQLIKSVRGDLDWIVTKALEKDRTRRYQTAHSMALDIEHHLNNEPVLARPPSKIYRFRKLVRRNKRLFAAVVAVAVTLFLGVIVSTWLAFRAIQAEREQSRLREEAVAAQEMEAVLRHRAQANELAMRQLVYASDMSMAQKALAMNDLGRSRRLLYVHLRETDGLDLRGWEWGYLWHECQSDAIAELHRYLNSVYSVAYSADGRFLAVTGLLDQFVEIWDVSERKRVKALQPDEGNLVVFSPRGDLLATDAGKQIRVWEVDGWRFVTQLPIPDDAKYLKFSPDGSLLACLNYSYEVILWNVGGWDVARRIGDVRPVSYWGGLDFSPDGKALVVGDYDQRLQVFDLDSGATKLDVPQAHLEGITSVAWSPNGSVIASGSGFSSGAIRLWDTSSGKQVGELKGHTSWICKLTFSKDGARLYSASGDQTIRIWNVKEQRCVATLRGNSHEVYGLSLSPDGDTLASACKDGAVALWDARIRSKEEQPKIIELGQFARPVFAPDSQVLAVPRSGTVSLFNPVTCAEIEKVPALGSGDVSTIAFSPDGAVLLSGSYDGRVRVWSCAERRLVRDLHEHNEAISWFFFRAEGARLLSVDGKGKAVWWDTQTWKAGKNFEVELVEDTEDIDLSPDGRLLLVSTKGSLRWINAETGELLATTAGPPNSTARVAFSGDGSHVAGVVEYGTAFLWSSESFKLVAKWDAHMQAAHGVGFSPDGRLATSGGTIQDAIKIWDLSTRRELLTLPLPGNSSPLTTLIFSPDGKWLSTCSAWEGNLYLWRSMSWTEVKAVEEKLLHD